MLAPETPPNEVERLRQLHEMGILDTPPEERFDRLTRIAKRLFDVPIATISIIDEDRQWFKSNQGLDAAEGPRDTSFCGHAILGEDVFLIPDTTQDQRFHDNPLVTDDPNIKFYAGFPLRSQGGAKLGTLCVIDKKPRSFEKDDIKLLEDLARMVEEEFTSARTATTDELTGMLNRRGFTQLAEHSLDFCRRRKMKACLLFLDLNDFKKINDTYGHAEGDEAYRRRRAASLAFRTIARALLCDVGWPFRVRRGKSKDKGKASGGGRALLIRKRWQRSRKGERAIWDLKHVVKGERRSALKRVFTRAARAFVRPTAQPVEGSSRLDPFRNWGGTSQRAYLRVAGTARRALFPGRRGPSNRPPPPTPRL
jgi:hypothetical protein